MMSHTATFTARATDPAGLYAERVAVGEVLRRRPQLLSIAVGHYAATKIGQPGYTVGELVSRYDVVHGYMTPDNIGALLSAKPDIVLLKYDLFHSRMNQTEKATEKYLKDSSTGSNVTKANWYMLNVRDPAMRSEMLRDTLASMDPRFRGLWLDVIGPDYVSSTFTTSDWHPTSNLAAVADLGDLDGGWTPLMSRLDRPKYTDAMWPHYSLAWLREIRSALPDKILVWNGLLTQGAYNGPSFWRDQEGLFLASSDGAAKEAMFSAGGLSSGFVFQPESIWRHWLDRAVAVLATGKIVHVSSRGAIGTDSGRRYLFATYLLLADGQRAWFFVDGGYDSALYDADYGDPLGPYEIVAGPLYKRRFQKATVWVNPGSTQRSGDGKRLQPNTAVIEVGA